jgi:signal transduction histidine kinase
MLRFGNIDLERRHQPVDLCDVKPSAHAAVRRPAPRAGATVAPTAGRELRLDQLAHELNSLLDGSLRCLSLAEQAIGHAGSKTQIDLPSVLARLTLARQSMRQMAALLERVARSGRIGPETFVENSVIGPVMQMIVSPLQPYALQHEIELNVQIEPAAAALPIGPLAPVVMNGLRNALRAAAAATPPPGSVRRVDCIISLAAPDALCIRITDNGHGLAIAPRSLAAGDSPGHGIGLDLSRQIVASLGGTLALTDRACDDEDAPASNRSAGAALTVIVPTRSLTMPNPTAKGSHHP